MILAIRAFLQSSLLLDQYICRLVLTKCTKLLSRNPHQLVFVVVVVILKPTVPLCLNGGYQESVTDRLDHGRTSHFDNEKCFFPRVFIETPSPSCMLFRISLIWLDSFDYK